MPTCAWSTFIQHSTRDTCAAFRAQGWDVRELNMQAMLTPYHLTREINTFQPDLFLFIDHMRYEAEEVYPKNLFFITWIQDEMDHLFCTQAGESIARYAKQGKRDLVIGYTNQELSTRYHYPKERLVSVKIMADTRLFRPTTCSAEEHKRYDCDLAFMTNVSMSSEQLVEHIIIPSVEKWNIPPQTVHDIHDFLQQSYRAGKTYCNRTVFLDALQHFTEFSSAYNNMKRQEQDTEQLLRLFYWRLNDTLYRHTVLEWVDQSGLNLHLYGHGWEEHPRFHRYAKGSLEHGEELNIAYQCASYNLHLNITQGMHQRVWEILASGGTPLFRAREPSPRSEPPLSLMRKWANYFIHASPNQPFPEPEKTDTISQEWLFKLALNLTSEATTPATTQQVQKRVMEKIESIVTGRPDIMVETFEQQTFNSCDELLRLVQNKSMTVPIAFSEFC